MKKIKINTFLAIILILTLCLVKTQPQIKIEAALQYNYPTQQYRAVWISHYAGDISAYSSKTQYINQLTTVLNNIQEWGINAIVFHIRTHNNALYDSDLNPIASWWSNVNFANFDPLEWLIAECHARGIEFHAWLNPYRVLSTGVPSGKTLQDVCNTFQNFPTNPANNPNNLLVTSGGIILDPGIPTNREFIIETCMEIVEKYDVDAIHFDDYFYISGNDDSATRAIYNTENLSIGDFRRKQVDTFIQQLDQELDNFNKANNRAVQLGISPSGIYQNGSYPKGTTPQYNANGNLIYPTYSNSSGFAHYDNYLYSDTKKWIDNEWIDYITPQTYWGISHSTASFTNLIEWWSWATRYKKVNLYMGHGIYRTLEGASDMSSGYETENQLLAMADYPEIDGSCFYKYATLTSTDSRIVQAKNTLKTFWSKKLPASIVHTLDYLDEPLVTGFNLAENTLSWNEVDNVRGYMVWKVAFGQTVDMSNINHVYAYVNTNSIEIEQGYDYYVSSVNKANEFSEPRGLKSLSGVDEVISSIADISFPVTNSQKTLINAVNAMYQDLSTTDKAKVYNAKALEQALLDIAVIDNLYNQLPTSVDNIHITKRMLLPRYVDEYSLRWSYVNPSDSEYYNIDTGEIVKQKLSTNIIQLKVVASKNGYSFEKVVGVNVGMTGQEQMGLFYRNDPASMSKNDGTIATGYYIGWSNVSVSTADWILYVANGNYFELTTSTIPSPNASSCGRIYVNKSGSPITNTAENFKVSSGANYGYIIIDSNSKVVASASNVTLSTSITLGVNETLIANAYLDALITDSPILPISKIAVSSTVVITKHTDGTSNQEIAEFMISEINKLPSTLTLVHCDFVDLLNTVYQNLPSEIKALVTNSAALTQAKTTCDQLTSAQNNDLIQKNNKLSVLSTYYSGILSNYNSNVQKAILAYYDYIARLVIYNPLASADNYIADGYALITAINDEEENKLEDEKLAALVYIAQVMPNLELYSSANQQLINNLYTQCEANINNATTVDEINQIIADFLNELHGILTIEGEFKAYKDAKCQEIVTLVVYTNYAKVYHTTLAGIVADAKNQFDYATTYELVDSIYVDAIRRINEIPTLEQEALILASAKTDGIDTVNNYVVLADYSSSNQAIIEAIIEKAVEDINSALTIAEINDIVSDALEELDKVEKDGSIVDDKKDAKDTLLAIINEATLTTEQKQIVMDLYYEYAEAIDAALDVLEIDEILVEGREVIKQKIKDLTKKEPASFCPSATAYSAYLFGIIFCAIVILKKRQD